MAPPSRPDAKKQGQIPPTVNDIANSVRQAGGTNKIDRAQWAADAPRRIAELEKYVNHQLQINLTSWKEEIDQAIGQAAYPVKPESQIYWFIALAGNLLWAATCFVAPEAAVVVKAAEKDATAVAKVAFQSRVVAAMSVTGAAVGSGAVEKLFPNRDVDAITPEDGKNLVRDWAGKQRAVLEDIYKEQRRAWATQLDGKWDPIANGEEPLDIYDRTIWENMFPRISYDDDRFNAIRHTAKRKVEGVLADFNRQWQKFQTDLMMPKYNQSYALWAYGTLALVPTQFVAKLNINLN